MNLFFDAKLKASVAKARKARRVQKAMRIARGPTKAMLAKSLKVEKNKLRIALHKAIRERDGAVCISTGKAPLIGHDWQAGHLFAVGPYPALQFHPLNIHSQGSYANCYLRGDHAAYSAEVIRRYGLPVFEALDAIKSEPRQWTACELSDLRAALLEGGLDAYQALYFDLTRWSVR